MTSSDPPSTATHIYAEVLDMLGPPPGPTPDGEQECGAEVHDEDEEQQ